MIKAVLLGDMDAFDEIVTKYRRRIERTVYGILGDSDEAEDVGQETFIRFYRSLKNFRGDSSIGTYLTRIAINLSLNELKRRKKRQKMEKEMMETAQVENREQKGPDNSDEELVRRSLDDLPIKYREVIVLRLIDDLSTEETARILKVPVGTVLSRLSRGQEILRKTLKLLTGGTL